MKWVIVPLTFLRGGWQMIESSNGRFFVRYQDGQRSKRFHYANARTYANLFGGVIVHRTTGRIWPTMKPDFSPPGKNFALPREAI